MKDTLFSWEDKVLITVIFCIDTCAYISDKSLYINNINRTMTIVLFYWYFFKISCNISCSNIYLRYLRWIFFILAIGVSKVLTLLKSIFHIDVTQYIEKVIYMSNDTIYSIINSILMFIVVYIVWTTPKPDSIEDNDDAIINS